MLSADVAGSGRAATPTEALRLKRRRRPSGCFVLSKGPCLRLRLIGLRPQYAANRGANSRQLEWLLDCAQAARRRPHRHRGCGYPRSSPEWHVWRSALTGASGELPATCWALGGTAACYARRRARSGVIEPSRRSSATSTSSRQESTVLISSRRRGKRMCGRTVLNPTASR